MSIESEIYDLESITLILDQPRGFGLRFQILNLTMSQEEHASFFQWDKDRTLKRLDSIESKQNEHSKMLEAILENQKNSNQKSNIGTSDKALV